MKIGVVGSINIDLVVKVSRIPNKGETLVGDSFSNFPGGKGANQAVAISRLGEEVVIFGCVGNDQYGKILLENLGNENVDTSYIGEVDGVNSGIALITISENDNSIIVLEGANAHVDKKYINSVKSGILDCDLIIMQNEIPMETVKYVCDICYENNLKVILNPAPAKPISEDLISKISYLTPNEHEVKLIFDGNDIGEIMKKYSSKLIVTEGDKGVSFADGSQEIINIPSRKSNVVDTTGAGDTFNGAFCVGLAKGMDLIQCIRFANIAAGLSTEKFGAQSGMPDLQTVFNEFDM